jgi:hypothetical protein
MKLMIANHRDTMMQHWNDEVEESREADDHE